MTTYGNDDDDDLRSTFRGIDIIGDQQVIMTGRVKKRNRFGFFFS